MSYSKQKAPSFWKSLGLISLLTSQPIFSLIVQDGKVVAEWSDRPPISALGKKSVGEVPFYNNPKGTIFGLMLLVDFSDQQAPRTKEEVNNWLNLKGFNLGNCKGSVRDYFAEVSNGKLDLQNEVFGYYRAQNPKSYYENLPGYDGSTLLVNEMIAYFDPLVDFSRYDNDKDGKTESISIVYAGRGLEFAQGLWPHAGGLGVKKDGVTLSRYMMTDFPGDYSLYVFCHESGHMLFGWPDLYWFGDYCLMGNRMDEDNPVAINDFYRADQGWIPTVEVEKTTNTNYHGIPNNAGYRYINPAKPQEMYFWSNVKNSGRWSRLRGSGILMFHFDKSKGGNSGPGNLSLSVVEAKGKEMQSSKWPSPGSAANDFYYQGNNSEISDLTNPSTKWNDGSASSLKIYDIGTISSDISFKVGTGIFVSINPINRPRHFGRDQRFMQYSRGMNGQSALATSSTKVFNLNGVKMEFLSPGKFITQWPERIQSSVGNPELITIP